MGIEITGDDHRDLQVWFDTGNYFLYSFRVFQQESIDNKILSLSMKLSDECTLFQGQI
jgi:hypothetical protein